MAVMHYYDNMVDEPACGVREGDSTEKLDGVSCSRCIKTTAYRNARRFSREAQ